MKSMIITTIIIIILMIIIMIIIIVIIITTKIITLSEMIESKNKIYCSQEKFHSVSIKSRVNHLLCRTFVEN